MAALVLPFSAGPWPTHTPFQIRKTCTLHCHWIVVPGGSPNGPMECGEKFMQASSLRRHVIEAHLAPNGNQYLLVPAGKGPERAYDRIAGQTAIDLYVYERKWARTRKSAYEPSPIILDIIRRADLFVFQRRQPFCNEYNLGELT
ncbi:MAG: hypothetical protein MMC33_003405, partial [Icmadophila ericetorum]|nr:hypothetical protein [Icmadophila ericetorum]